jgi:SAM-dependent methyltransferase
LDPQQRDWPMSDGDVSEEVYARWASVYDVLLGELAPADDAAFYIGVARDCAGPGGAVLELGMGTGRVTGRLLEAGFEVLGVDSSKEMLAQAARKLGDNPRFRAIHGDVRKERLGRTFRLAIAPYGMVAHLLTDADRVEAFRATWEHLEPGGVFAFDDMPGWLAGKADGTHLEQRLTGHDAATGMPVRLLSNAIEVAGKPLTVRYDLVDWLAGSEVARRLVIRVVFRNVPLDDELRMLREAGFSRVDVLADFRGRPFDRRNLAANQRLIVLAHRAG